MVRFFVLLLMGLAYLPPHHLDTTRAERAPGVLMVVTEDDLVGVIGEREDIADYALAAIGAR